MVLSISSIWAVAGLLWSESTTSGYSPLSFFYGQGKPPQVFIRTIGIQDPEKVAGAGVHGDLYIFQILFINGFQRFSPNTFAVCKGNKIYENIGDLFVAFP